MTEKSDYLTVIAESMLGEREIALNTDIDISTQESFPETESFRIKDFPVEGDEHSVSLKMSGRHLTENLSTALMATDIFLDGNLDMEKAKTGLSTAFIPGPMQLTGRDPYIVLDGAHNPQAVENLMDTVERGFKAGRYSNVHILYGAMADKDIASIMTIFRKYPSFQLYFTQIDHFRGASIEQLREAAGRGHEYFTEAEAGFDTIVDRVHSDELVLVTGSLYLVSEILQKKGAGKCWQQCFKPLVLTPEGFDFV